jgi:hypothetical protein
MVACIDFFEMSEICRPKFIVRHSTYSREQSVSNIQLFETLKENRSEILVVKKKE